MIKEKNVYNNHIRYKIVNLYFCNFVSTVSTNLETNK